MAFLILSPSDFVITIASETSIIPLLIPCNSSPAPASINNKKKSTKLYIIVSDCPTPTVSIKITSNPAASHRIIASFVCLAIPPNCLPAEEGLIKAEFDFESNSILVLSPKILPLVVKEEGSILKTATLFPLAIK